MEKEEKRRFLEQKMALWWGLGRYVLNRLSVSGAESRQLYVYIDALRSPFTPVLGFMPLFSSAWYNVARPHFRHLDAARG